MMYRLRKSLKLKQNAKRTTTSDNTLMYDQVFSKSLQQRETKSCSNQKARKNAAEYYLKVKMLQYNTLLCNREKSFSELINYRLFVDFIVPLGQALNPETKIVKSNGGSCFIS